MLLTNSAKDVKNNNNFCEHVKKKIKIEKKFTQ